VLTPHVFAWQLDELEEKSAEQQALSATMIAELRYAAPALPHVLPLPHARA